MEDGNDMGWRARSEDAVIASVPAAVQRLSYRSPNPMCGCKAKGKSLATKAGFLNRLLPIGSTHPSPAAFLTPTRATPR